MKALILAGGLGTRLQPYTFFVPKPMLPLADKPLLEHLVMWLKGNGVSEIVISISYLGHQIREYFGNGETWDMKLSYASSRSPLGIGGQIRAAKDQMGSSSFYILYGDSVFDFSLKEMLDFHRESNACLTMGLMRYSEKIRYGLIERDPDSGKVLQWQEKPEIKGLVNVGCYVAEPTLFDYIPEGKMYGFDNVVRDMMKSNGRIFSYVIEGKQFLDIGDKESYAKVYDLYMNKLGKIL